MSPIPDPQLAALQGSHELLDEALAAPRRVEVPAVSVSHEPRAFESILFGDVPVPATSFELRFDVAGSIPAVRRRVSAFEVWFCVGAGVLGLAVGLVIGQAIR